MLAGGRATLTILLGAASLQGACTPTSPITLQHGISGPIHVLTGPLEAVAEACRGVGVDTEAGQIIKGCYLRAGKTHWIWAATDPWLQDTLAHEIRHAIDGPWHP